MLANRVLESARELSADSTFMANLNSQQAPFSRLEFPFEHEPEFSQFESRIRWKLEVF